MRKKRSARKSARRRAVAPPLRAGVNASRTVLPEGHWTTLGQWAADCFGEQVWQAFRDGDFLADGAVVLSADHPYRAGEHIWVFRPILDEPIEPIELDVLAEDDRILVVDKPHGMASIPRGSHVANTVTVAARRQFGNDELVCAHRLDLETAGVVLLTKAPEFRAAYQDKFSRREISKEYRAVAPLSAFDSSTPDAGEWQRYELLVHRPAGQLNVEFQWPTVSVAVPEAVSSAGAGEGWSRAVSQIRLERILAPRENLNIGVYNLRPETGYLHQLRVTMLALGLPILSDPLYPRLMSKAEEAQREFPLQLLASKLAFEDPYTGQWREFTSRRKLALE